MNSFERFGIDHLSPSAINLWRSAPGLWVLRYIGKIKDDANPGFWRGTATETGMGALLYGKDLKEACTLAHQTFDMNANGRADDETTAERSLIEPMLGQCRSWAPPGDLNATQIKVEYWFEHIPVPVIGYLDFAFDGIDIDLKTTKACPSSPRADHIRQVSLYRAARGRAGAVLYVTGKKREYFPIDDDMMQRALGDMADNALSLNNFLARCDTRADALKSLPVDWDHFQAPKNRVPLSDVLLAG